jgi:hypothetical protein
MSQTKAELQAQIEALKAQLKAMPKVNPVTFKVSEKKALSMYGLGRFPVTLYAGQWRRLIDHIDAVKAALETHKSELAEKVTAETPTPVTA